MKDLIEALQIFAKYSTTKWPTNCSHDLLAIMEVDRSQLTDSEHKRVEELGFIWDDSEEVYISYKFGSA